MIILRQTCKLFHYCCDINKKFLTIILLLISKYLFVSFQKLIEKVRPFITKQTTKFRTPIPAEERLAITLRYLTTGETYESFNLEFIGPLFLRLFKRFLVPFTKYYNQITWSCHLLPKKGKLLLMKDIAIGIFQTVLELLTGNISRY